MFLESLKLTFVSLVVYMRCMWEFNPANPETTPNKCREEHKYKT